MEEQISSALKQRLEELARPVGFSFKGSAASIDQTSPPEATLVWESSFAVLALVPISAPQIETLTATQQAAQDWMWRRLTEDERIGRFLDGYLLFALPTRPRDAMRNSVQALELDTAVCRKHVIWPAPEDDWSDALLSVTVLGLPSVQTPVSTLVTLPELPAAANLALKLYDKHKNYETAAEKLRDEARSLQTEGDPDAS
jgi:hypothetical protein